MSILIQANNISWQINDTTILNDISLELRSGEMLGIIGPNGAGKTTLLKMLARITKPFAGTLTFLDEPYEEIEAKQFAKKIAYLEQNAPVNWPLLVEKVIELGRSPYQSSYKKLSKDDDAAIKKAIQATGIDRLLGRTTSTLSQGEKMLVALCRVFSSEPKVVLADEPIAALDPYHQLLIMELLQGQTRAKQNHAAIVVLHDLSHAARFCDRLVLMHEGKIVSSGSTEEVLSSHNLREFYKINCYSDFAQGLIQPLNRI